MRFIKLAFLSLFFLFLVITAISLFIPSHIRISRAVQIEAEKDFVWQQVVNPVNWKHWYPGADTSSLIYISGKARGIQFQNQGSKVLMDSSTKNNEVKATVININARRINMGWLFIPQQNSVTVQWYMDFHLQWYPWQKFSSLLYEKIYGVKMEEGLHALKTFADKSPHIQ